MGTLERNQYVSSTKKTRTRLKHSADWEVSTKWPFRQSARGRDRVVRVFNNDTVVVRRLHAVIGVLAHRIAIAIIALEFFEWRRCRCVRLRRRPESASRRRRRLPLRRAGERSVRIAYGRAFDRTQRQRMYTLTAIVPVPVAGAGRASPVELSIDFSTQLLPNWFACGR